MTGQSKPRIVVLGGGLGGTVAAYELRETLGDRAEIHLVSDRTRFSFTPSNPWVAVGWRKPEAIQIELAPVLARKSIGFTGSAVEHVVPGENRLELADGSGLVYDYLVIATGPELAFDEIEGFGPKANTVSICTTSHAEAAYEAFERFCADPGPIVVGAVQGASCFGPAYEFAMILDTELRRRNLRHKVPMTFVTPEPYIGHLGLDGVGDTKSMLESELRNRTIKWVTNSKITRFTPGTIAFEELRESGDPLSHELAFKFAMMLPAFRGIKPLQGIEGGLSRGQRDHEAATASSRLSIARTTRSGARQDWSPETGPLSASGSGLNPGHNASGAKHDETTEDDHRALTPVQLARNIMSPTMATASTATGGEGQRTAIRFIKAGDALPLIGT